MSDTRDQARVYTESIADAESARVRSSKLTHACTLHVCNSDHIFKSLWNSSMIFDLFDL